MREQRSPEKSGEHGLLHGPVAKILSNSLLRGLALGNSQKSHQKRPPLMGVTEWAQNNDLTMEFEFVAHFPCTPGLVKCK